MPYDTTFKAPEAPDDFDDTFDGTIDLYNSLIINAKEIYHYLNEEGYYANYKGAGIKCKQKYKGGNLLHR